MQDVEPGEDALRILHKTIDAVTTMTEDLRFNTAISQMMVFVNEMTAAARCGPRAVLEPFVLLLAPYAPHLAEELWSRLGHDETLAYEPWPVADPQYLVERHDHRGGAGQRQGARPARGAGRRRPRTTSRTPPWPARRSQPWLEGKEIVKTIYVPGKLVNLVVK